MRARASILALLLVVPALPIAAAGPEDQPHAHDRWRDQEEIALVEQAVFIEPLGTAFEPLNRCRHDDAQDGGVCLGSATFGLGTWPDGFPHIVPPGTDHLEIRVNWSSRTIDGLQMYYQTRQRDDWHHVGDDPSFAESGAVRTVEVDLRQADAGHARLSEWRFRLEAHGNPAGRAPGLVSVGSGVAHVEIVADRADDDLPLEPAHPELYNETSIYQIGRVNASIGPVAQADRVVASPSGIDVGSEGVQWLLKPGHVGKRDGAVPTAIDRIDAKHVIEAVPPRTRTLLASIEVDVEASLGAQPNVCLVGTQDRVRPREHLRELVCSSVHGHTTIVAIQPLTTSDWDHLYTPLDGYDSNWLLGLRIRPDEGLFGPPATVYRLERVSMCLFASEDVYPTVPDWGAC